MPLLPQGPSMPDGDRGLGTICHTTPSQSQASFHGRQSTLYTVDKILTLLSPSSRGKFLDLSWCLLVYTTYDLPTRYLHHLSCEES